MEKNRHDKTQECKNGAKQAFSRFLSHNRTSKNAIQPKWTNEYVTALDFLKNENLSQLENWKPVSQKHKKLALAVENLKILLDLDTGRF